MYFIKALVASKVLLLGAVVYAATSSQGGAYQSHDDEIDNGFGAPLNGSQGGGAGLLPRFAVAADGFTDDLTSRTGLTQSSLSSRPKKKLTNQLKVNPVQEQHLDGSKSPVKISSETFPEASDDTKTLQAASKRGYCGCFGQLCATISSSRCVMALSEWIATNIFGKPDVKLEFSPGLWYWAKRWLHLKAMQNAFTRAETSVVAISPPGSDLEDLVPWTTFGVPLPNVYTARRLPRAERSVYGAIGAWAFINLHKHFSLTTGEQPEIPEDPETLMALSYPQQNRQLMQAPQVPSQMSSNADDLIGALALVGPFANQVKKSSDPSHNDLYEVDFSAYEQFPVKEGLYRLGGRATLQFDAASQSLQTVSITYGGASYAPDSEEWTLLQRIMLATLLTQTIMVDHLLHAHLIICGTFASVNNRYLSANHPLRIFMNPHQWFTLSVNLNAVPTIVGFGTAFAPSVFSYDSAEINKIMPLIAGQFSIHSMDIVESLKSRQMLDPDCGALAIPYQAAQNLLELYTILHKYVGNYLDTHYSDDAAVANDGEIQEWLKQLHNFIPNGVNDYVGEISKASIQKLVTMFVYTATVEHTRAGRAIYNYALWSQYVPLIVRVDGRRVSIGMHQDFTNLEFATDPLTYRITDDFSTANSDDKLKTIIKELNKDMEMYQTKLEEIGIHCGTICPVDIAISISE